MLENLLRIGEVAGAGAAMQAALERLGAPPRLVAVSPGGIRHPVWMRVRTSDVSAYQQIFLRREYAFEVTRTPRTIVDAGANVGYASVYFANRYPDATIVALEPEPSNFELLVKNTAPYPNVRPVHGALWSEDGELDIVSVDSAGHWGTMTQMAGEQLADARGRVSGATPAFSVPTLMARHGLDHVDIFKIDIEGAEREVFADPSAWLPRVDALIVELHEHRKPGCEPSFRAATAAFGRTWLRGENEYLARPRSCLVVPEDSRPC
jgi:FkbM family methyltransferase